MSTMFRSLDSVSYTDTKVFIPPIECGKVVQVYDGDTFTIATFLFGEFYRFSVRLYGIDTPEIKTKDAKMKSRAILARDALRQLIMNKIVELKNVEYEKYGRLMAHVYVDGINVNDWMIHRGHGVVYTGGKKVVPEEWITDGATEDP